MEQTLKLIGGESQKSCHVAHGFHLDVDDFAISTSDVDEEIHELQATLERHLVADEHTTLLHESVVSFRSLLIAELTLVLEELLKQSLSLAQSTFAKVGTKEGAHVFHFAVHNLAVRIHHIGGKHHERGEKVVRSQIFALAKHLGVNIVGSSEVVKGLFPITSLQGTTEGIANASSKNGDIYVST